MSDSAILTQLCCLKEQLRQPNTNHFVVDNDTELSVFEVCDIIPASTCSVTSDGSHTISYDLQEGTATFSSITDDIFGKTCNIFEGKYIYIAGNKLLTSKITVNEFGLYVYKDINHPDSDEIINSTSTNIYYFYKIDIPEKIVPLKEVFCFTNCNLTNRYYIDLNTQLYTPKGVITTCPNADNVTVDNEWELVKNEVCDDTIIKIPLYYTTDIYEYYKTPDVLYKSADGGSIIFKIYVRSNEVTVPIDGYIQEIKDKLYTRKYLELDGNRLLTSKITYRDVNIYEPDIPSIGWRPHLEIKYTNAYSASSDEIINSSLPRFIIPTYEPDSTIRNITGENAVILYNYKDPVPIIQVLFYKDGVLTKTSYLDNIGNPYSLVGTLVKCKVDFNVVVDNEYEYVDIGNFYDPIDSSEYKAVQTYKNGILTDTKFYSYPSLLLQTTIVPPNQNTLYIPVDTTYNGIYQLNTINQVATFEVNKFKDISIQSLSGVGTILIEDGDKVSNITLLPGYNISYSSNRLLKSKIVVTATSSDANIIVAYITPYPNQVI